MDMIFWITMYFIVGIIGIPFVPYALKFMNDDTLNDPLVLLATIAVWPITLLIGGGAWVFNKLRGNR